ncbi:MAG: hypothetical protein LBV27_08755 [Oscillospiraceae bacterium]|jgi:cell division protein FtsL|nr:hypothetical protein [Oscillospiraceae bacterium]
MASAYNTSSAYDFSAYEVGQSSKRNADGERLRVVRTPKQFIASVVTPKTFCLFAMAVTVICLMVYNNVCLTEVTGEINELTSDIAEMQNENVRLQSERNSLVSPRSVAEYAENELGLKRLDKYQTQYIYLYHEDKIEMTEAAPKGSIVDQVQHTFNTAVDTIKEYIAGW